MKKVKQYRFFSGGSSDDSGFASNYPSDISLRKLVSGSIFSECLPIIQLGILALPGTKFYVNKSTDPIIIDYTGIFTLDLADGVEITYLTFDTESLEFISSSPDGYLIIDTIYEAED